MAYISTLVFNILLFSNRDNELNVFSFVHACPEIGRSKWQLVIAEGVYSFDAFGAFYHNPALPGIVDEEGHLWYVQQDGFYQSGLLCP